MLADSVIKLGLEVNSLPDKEFSKMCIGSFITRYWTHCDGMFFMTIP